MRSSDLLLSGNELELLSATLFVTGRDMHPPGSAGPQATAQIVPEIGTLAHEPSGSGEVAGAYAVAGQVHAKVGRLPSLRRARLPADYALCAFVEFAAAEQHRTASYRAASRAGKC